MNWNVQAVTIMKTQSTKLRDKPTTIGMADLKPIGCATRLAPLEWPTDRFIWNASCEAVWWNKFWNKKIYGWFHSYFLSEKFETNQN